MPPGAASSRRRYRALPTRAAAARLPLQVGLRSEDIELLAEDLADLLDQGEAALHFVQGRSHAACCRRRACGCPPAGAPAVLCLRHPTAAPAAAVFMCETCLCNAVLRATR